MYLYRQQFVCLSVGLTMTLQLVSLPLFSWTMSLLFLASSPGISLLSLFPFLPFYYPLVLQYQWFYTFSLPSPQSLSGLLASIIWSHCMLKSHSTLVLSVSCTLLCWCSKHLSALSNSYNLHSSQWMILATLSCLLLYSLCASLLHSLT